jgi:hypothetical protein
MRPVAAKSKPASGKAAKSSKTAGRAAAKRSAASKGKAKKRSSGSGSTRKQQAKEPRVKLGTMAENGIAGSLFGLLERGVSRQPRIARSTEGTVMLRFKEDFAPIRISFDKGTVTVEDIPEEPGRRNTRPDLTVSGSLPDIVHLATAPLIGGIPRLTHARGRAALARFAGGRVKIEGSPLLARRLLKMLEI